MAVIQWKDKTTIDAEAFEKRKQSARAKRDGLLKETDYIVMPDCPLADKSEWQAYRQALRDVPDQPSFPDTIDWPTKPGGSA